MTGQQLEIDLMSLVSHDVGVGLPVVRTFSADYRSGCAVYGANRFCAIVPKNIRALKVSILSLSPPSGFITPLAPGIDR